MFAGTYCRHGAPEKDPFGGLTKGLNGLAGETGRICGQEIASWPRRTVCGAACTELAQWPRLCLGYREFLLSRESFLVAGYTLETIEQLSRQLLLSPPRLRLRQIEGAEYLLNLVEPGRAYPYDLVLFHVTHYRRAGSTEAEYLLEGRQLIADLVQLVDDLSASVDLDAARVCRPCLTVEELGARFRISPKTINRWRQRGLVSYRAVMPDGRRRMVFPDRAVRRFVGKYPALVKRASSFSKLTASERRAIIDRARELVDAGMTKISEVLERLTDELDRSTETIRYVLRRYDQENPEDRLFDRKAKPLGREDHLRIYRCYRSGDSVPDLARRFGRTTSNIYRVIQEIRAKELLSRDIEYIHSEEFDLPNADELILRNGTPSGRLEARGRRTRRPTGDLPAYLKELYDLPLLKRQQERELFRRYNYLKFKAKRLAATIDPRRPRSRSLNELDDLLTRADEIKNELIQSNLRLVVSIAKKHVRNGEDLFALVSDGNLSLMKAVEKYDYARGNKFSTYASWAIMKNYARSIPDERTRLVRYQTGSEELLSIAPDREDHMVQADRRLEGVREALEQVLETLTTRERTIVTRHFGLTKDGRCHTLDQIGKLFGVSKERARQLEKRALRKLRETVGPAFLEAVLG